MRRVDGHSFVIEERTYEASRGIRKPLFRLLLNEHIIRQFMTKDDAVREREMLIRALRDKHRAAEPPPEKGE